MNKSKYYFIAIFLIISSLLKCYAAVDRVDIEVIAEINKTGYIGETFEYTVTLKSSISNIADIRLVSGQNMPEKVTVINGSVQNQKAREVEEKGKKYYCWTIQRKFIIPQEKGKFTIGDAKFVAFIPKERIVKDFFWGSRRVVDYEEYPVECKSVSFKADILPANKSGMEFSGAIGEYEIEGWFPPGNITAGQEAIVVFTISGFGNLENVKIPNISKIFNSGCRLREVERDDTQHLRNGRLYSEITLTCSFIPESSDFIIDSLTLLVFNPQNKKYEVIKSEVLHWDGSDNHHPSKTTREAIEI